MFSTGMGESDLDQAQVALKSYALSLNVTPGEPTLPQNSNRSGWVYFASCDRPDFPIKIGWATNVKQRLRPIQGSLPYDLVLLGALRGALDDERRLHIGFNEFRLRGEWFARNPDLMDLIKRCQIQEVA